MKRLIYLLFSAICVCCLLFTLASCANDDTPPVDTQSDETQPNNTQPDGTQPNDTQPDDTQTTESLSPDTSSSAGLEFTLQTVNGVQSYVLTGIGTCTETDLVIGTYQNLPVTTIGESAFRDCTNLTSITILDGVTTIRPYAFYGCSGLTNITISDSVTTIEDDVFNGCMNLTYTCYNNGKYLGNSKNPYVVFIEVIDTEATSFTLPETTKVIYDYAFEDCTELTNITISGSVTTIGMGAFHGCSGLTSITIPNSVTTIDPAAFYGCSGLTSITIGNSVTNIGFLAFYGCSGLTSITIPDSVTSIGENAFFDCSGLTNITIPFVGQKKDGTGNTHFGAIFGYVSDTYYDYDNNNCVPTSLKTVVITGETSIGDFAFSGCSGLTSITIPDNVTSIGDSAFRGCTGLTSITIPDSVTSIGEYAFYNCSGLTSITIPFVGQKKEGTGRTHFGAIFGASSYSNHKNYVPASLKTVVITGGTSIGDVAFYNCSGLTSITIPDSVTSIGYSAFSGCTGLTSITVAEGNTVYHSAGNCLIETASKNLISGCQNSVIPNDGSVTTIRDYAFEYCTGLTSITIPDSVTSIESFAFYGCSGLTSITVAEDNTVYHSVGNCLIETAGKTLILGCKNSVIPHDGSVTIIGNCAFCNCAGLTSITLPDSVTAIGDSAFSWCQNLTHVYYCGSPTEWSNIRINLDNSALTSATRYYYSETQPTDTTYKYWHYVDGVPTPW